MFKVYTFFIFSLLSVLSYGQIDLLGEVDVSDYPNVAFSINHSNPDVLSESIQVRQAMQADFILASEVNVVKTVAKVSSENKCVLFLFEYSTHEDKEEQYLTFYSALVKALPEIVIPGDEIKICSFSLKKPNNKFLHEVNEKFTDNTAELIHALNNNLAQPRNHINKFRTSALYASIFEGVQLLKDHPSILPKSIVLLSEERNNRPTNLSNSILSTDLARTNNISINTIKYNWKGTYQYHDASISSLSYGVARELSRSTGYFTNSKKKSETIKILRDLFREIPKRALGSVFEIKATLPDTLLDGSKKTIKINSSDDDGVTSISFMGKGNRVMVLFQMHFILSILVSIIVTVLLIVSLFIVVSKRKKNLARKNANEILLKTQRETQRTQLDIQQKELDDLRVQDVDRKIAAEKQNTKDTNEAEERRLFIEMQNLGQLPLLIISGDHQEKTITINKSVFWVGRDSSNDLVINNSNFSKRHFYIRFRDEVYSIYDNSSTNGVRLNGKLISTHTLSDTDVIQIASIKFTFIN